MYQDVLGVLQSVTGVTGEEKKEGKSLQTDWQAGIEGSTRDPRGPQNIPSFALDPSFP